MVFRRVKFYTCLMRMCQALGFKKNCGVFSSLVEGLVEEVGVMFSTFASLGRPTRICGSWGPFQGPFIRCRTILGTRKGTHI